MIQVGLSVLLTIYLLIFLAVIFSVWMTVEIVRRKRETRSRRYYVKCPVCGTEYESQEKSQLPRCPECGTLNERNKIPIH